MPEIPSSRSGRTSRAEDYSSARARAALQHPFPPVVGMEVRLTLSHQVADTLGGGIASAATFAIASTVKSAREKAETAGPRSRIASQCGQPNTQFLKAL